MIATHHFFQEKRPGWFSHTAASLVVREDEDLRCAGHYMLDEMLKAATSTSDCIKASAKANSSVTPFTVRFGAPMFKYYEQNPEYATRFAKAMAGATRGMFLFALFVTVKVRKTGLRLVSRSPNHRVIA
ncbi:hypothetical protein BDV25DRAFT_86725 [Aspergillus avenaceus]|uniref:Uncharacterized protein n=1 Tax=Aspergillus avenaceus TaxID=36643 RepID=A0A5N6TZP1_ASPAV|nr:hypothetical protein BDV25DRAFT_86725 [Aspergillus avenaceus]